MSKVINIEVDDEILDNLSKTLGKNKDLSASIKEILTTYIKKKIAHKIDPIFNLGTPVKSGFSDVSQNHDKYIYNKS